MITSETRLPAAEALRTIRAMMGIVNVGALLLLLGIIAALAVLLVVGLFRVR